MTTSSPARAADPKPRNTPKLQPFVVHRHDMWTSPPPAAVATHRRAKRAQVPMQQAAARTHQSSSSWWQLLAQFAGWPVRVIGLAWHLQGEIRDLNGLDDHLLADMGLTRAELRTALRRREHPHPERPAEPGTFGHP